MTNTWSRALAVPGALALPAPGPPGLAMALRRTVAMPGAVPGSAHEKSPELEPKLLQARRWASLALPLLSMICEWCANGLLMRPQMFYLGSVIHCPVGRVCASESCRARLCFTVLSGASIYLYCVPGERLAELRIGSAND